MALDRRLVAGGVGAAALGIVVFAACGQMFPGDTAPGAGSQPATTRSGVVEKPIEVIVPAVDKATKQISMPAAFWNEKMADWVETAVCGRPSDFLHETIVCTTTTKTIMVTKLREAGCVDADEWVANVADFPRVRGDRLMILLEVTRTEKGGSGKVETYPLDELLVYQGWGVSIGPFGWMFKGAPGEPRQKAAANATQPAQEQIYRDDPQVALRIQGIRNVSDSYVDHPLCYDDWIFPAFHYHRNYALLPAAVYDSNGDVPVKLIMQKVTEAELLQGMAKYWHDPAFAAYILKQMPLAEQIDRDKAELWKTLPALHEQEKNAAQVPGKALDVRNTEEFGKVSLLVATIEKEYAALDAAWVDWSCEHAQWETKEAAEIKELEAERKLWREHIDQKRDGSEQLWKAEVAGAKLRDLARQPDGPEKKAAGRHATGAQLAARSRAMLLDNKQVLDRWKYERDRLTADDPRAEWRQHIAAQVGLAECRQDLGEKGIVLGELMQKDGTEAEEAVARGAYQKAVVAATLAGLRVKLADVEFEIIKRETIENDPDLPEFKKQRDDIKAQISKLEAATRPAGTQPAAMVPMPK